MIVFSVVDYKSANKTIAYLKHICGKMRHDVIRFIVVDNSCDEKNYNLLIQSITEAESVEFNVCSVIKGYFDGVESIIVRNNDNGGYAKGNNLGFKIARMNWNFEVFIVSNNDLKIENASLNEENIRRIFQSNERIGLIGPKITNIDGQRQSPNRKTSIFKRWFWPLFFYPLDRFLRINADDIDNSGSRVVYYINGSFMIFKSEAFSLINGFDEKTFLFGEEPIIAERLRNSNFITVYEPEIQIIHEHSAVIGSHYNTIKKLELRYSSDRYYFKFYRHTPDFLLYICDLNFKIYKVKNKIISFLLKKK